LAVTDRFVYVDKPPGTHTHRLGPEDPPALSDAVARAHPECAGASPDPREGGAIHRLDAATSGIVAFARTRRAWDEGRRAMTESALKIYVAVIDRPWPPPPSTDISRSDAPPPMPLPDWAPPPTPDGALELAWALGAGSSADVVMARPDGRPARTRVWTLAHGRPDDARRWLALRLLTGRRHQARVHLATAGAPIVGDDRYGGSAHGVLLLRASVLEVDAVDGPIVAPAADDWPAPG
jgi:23S rRNA pseudouridine1911/1915/1917 synthase